MTFCPCQAFWLHAKWRNHHFAASARDINKRYQHLAGSTFGGISIWRDQHLAVSTFGGINIWRYQHLAATTSGINIPRYQHFRGINILYKDTYCVREPREWFREQFLSFLVPFRVNKLLSDNSTVLIY